MVTPENVSGGEGLSLQCTCLASLRLWFCLFCLHSRSRSSWTSFLELLSLRQSQTAQGAQCLEEAIHLILESSSIDSLKACGTDLYTTPHLLPMPRPLSPTFRPPKKKKKTCPMREICSTRPQELFQACYLWQLHNTIMMWIRKVLPLSHFPSSRYSFLLRELCCMALACLWNLIAGNTNPCMLQRLPTCIWHSTLKRKHFVLITLPSMNHCYDFSGFTLRTYLSTRPFSATASAAH